MRRLFLLLILFVFTNTVESQTISKVNLVVGSTFMSDAKLFNDTTLGVFPNRPFIQIGAGVQVKHVGFNLTYTFDVRQIQLTTVVTLFKRDETTNKLTLNF